MEQKLLDLVKECIKKGVLCVGAGLDENDKLYFEFSGFSKSDTAKLCIKDNKIVSITRYNTVNEIETFEDFAKVAYDWNNGYKDREPFGWDIHWLPIFEEYGWVEKKAKTVVEIIPKV